MNKFVDFDVKTITAGDYTLEFELNKKHFDHFIKNYYDDTNPMGEVAQLKLYIQLELEKRFNEMDSLGLDGPAEDDMTKKVEIAQITFAYDNAEVIEQLIFRGIEVKGEAWGNVEKINDKILKMVQKQECLDKQQRPCTVFVTMMGEEGYSRACIYTDAVSKNGPKYQE